MRKKIERRANAAPLKEVIEEFLLIYRLKDKLLNARALHAWPQVVGEMIARHTESLKIKNRTLFVKVDSSVVRSELLYARQKIMVSLNKAAGVVIIDEIVLS